MSNAPPDDDVSFRHNERQAQTLIERWLPDVPYRLLLLDVLARSIEAAHEAGPGKWGLVVYHNRVWLTVGRIVVANLRSGVLWLCVDRDTLPATLRDSDLLGEGYTAVPNSAGITINADTSREVIEASAPAHKQLIARAANGVRTVQGKTAAAHSPGMIAYLARMVQRAVPNPAYYALQNVWIFQANPAQYNLREELKRIQVGDTDTWSVTSFRREIKPGDKVLLWQSGPRAGIYAEGETTSAPYQPDEVSAALDMGSQSNQRSSWQVDFRYTDIRNDPLLRTTIKEHPKLAEMEIFWFPRGTNFRVTPTEWEALKELLNQRLPDQGPEPMPPALELLQDQLAARGFQFTPWQIASFYTALQAKGFVILSGISGTGKTKLAQHFAEILPQPNTALASETQQGIALTVKPYMARYSRLIIPKQATRLFDPPAPGATQDVVLRFGDQSQTCRLTHAVYGNTDYIALMLRGAARSWFEQTFEDGDTLTLEPTFDADQNLTGFGMHYGALVVSTPTTGVQALPNWLFIPVRPDWRDSKSLLGYFNPLQQEYVWTDFLRFVVRAERSYRAGESFAYFVILDEMNLARVEYYFADLLSVLESGRDKDGITREGLRLAYPDEAEGDLPPRTLHLPPNLFFVGTVNVDETTHAFSPKVLDRAFTIEFVEVDFTAYPPQMTADTPNLNQRQRQSLLQAFLLNGKAGQVNKADITAYLAGHPEVGAQLQTLNNLLRPYSMHFGYRVFDEIASFLASSDHNGTFDGLSGSQPAFDAAVLMKVLPKFNGSRGKLEGPLRSVLAWSINPEVPDRSAIDAVLDPLESPSGLSAALAKFSFRHRQTAARVERMLWSLYTDGFASFG